MAAYQQPVFAELYPHHHEVERHDHAAGVVSVHLAVNHGAGSAVVDQHGTAVAMLEVDIGAYERGDALGFVFYFGVGVAVHEIGGEEGVERGGVTHLGGGVEARERGAYGLFGGGNRISIVHRREDSTFVEAGGLAQFRPPQAQPN